MSDLNSVLIEGRVKQFLKPPDSDGGFALLSILHRSRRQTPRKNRFVVSTNKHSLLSELKVGDRVRVLGALDNDPNGKMRIKAEHIEKL